VFYAVNTSGDFREIAYIGGKETWELNSITYPACCKKNVEKAISSMKVFDLNSITFTHRYAYHVK